MDKNIIVSQLDAASKMIQSTEGTELYTGILDVCGELVNLVCSQLNCNDIDGENVKDITSCMSYIGKGLEGISKTAGQTECLKVNTQAIEKLAKAVSEHKELIEKEQNAKRELEIIEGEIKDLKPRAEKLEKDFKFQAGLKDSLEKSIEQYDDDKIKELEERNNELISDFAVRQLRCQELEEKQKEHIKKLDELDKKIENLPDEQRLVKEFDEKNAEYTRLLTAKEDCSEEKQLELSEKIAEIEDDVNKLEVAMKILKSRKEELDSAKTKIETEKGIFETDFIQKIENSMDDLKNHMRSHRDVLNGVKDDATELKKHIDECNVIYKNYCFMFDTNNTPLEAIAKASKTEHKELAKNFDINKSDYVSELKEEIENKLKELDGIIAECTKAITTDQKLLKVRAFGKDK